MGSVSNQAADCRLPEGFNYCEYMGLCPKLCPYRGVDRSCLQHPPWYSTWNPEPCAACVYLAAVQVLYYPLCTILARRLRKSLSESQFQLFLAGLKAHAQAKVGLGTDLIFETCSHALVPMRNAECVCECLKRLFRIACTRRETIVEMDGVRRVTWP